LAFAFEVDKTEESCIEFLCTKNGEILKMLHTNIKLRMWHWQTNPYESWDAK